MRLTIFISKLKVISLTNRIDRIEKKLTKLKGKRIDLLKELYANWKNDRSHD